MNAIVIEKALPAVTGRDDKSRRRGIFATDAAPIIGVAPPSWPTALDVYLRNVEGRVRDPLDPELADYGKTVEPFILRSLSRRLDTQVVPNDTTFVSKRLPWLGATPDGFVPALNAGVEAKTASNRSEWGEPGTGQIPLHYACQVAVQMIVTGFDLWLVPVSFGAQVEIYEVRRDNELFDSIEGVLAVFWQRIVAENPPEPVTVADARVRWPRDIGTTIVATPELCLTHRELVRIRAEIKDLEAIADQHTLTLQKALGENAGLMTEDGRMLVTWKAGSETRRVDVVRLREERPDVWEQFAAIIPPVRRFLVKT